RPLFRFALPQPCLRRPYLYRRMRSLRSRQQPASVLSYRQSLEHRHVSPRNELTVSAAGLCLPLFSLSSDEHAAALLCEKSPWFIERFCRPCDESARLHSERLCLYTAPVDKNDECPPRPAQPVFCPRPEL